MKTDPREGVYVFEVLIVWPLTAWLGGYLVVRELARIFY